MVVDSLCIKNTHFLKKAILKFKKETEKISQNIINILTLLNNIELCENIENVAHTIYPVYSQSIHPHRSTNPVYDIFHISLSPRNFRLRSRQRFSKDPASLETNKPSPETMIHK